MESTKLNVAKLFVQKKNQIISYTSWSTRQFQRMIDFLKQWIISCFSLKMFFFFFFNYQTMSTPFLTVWKQFLATFQVWQKILNEDFSLLATIKKKKTQTTHLISVHALVQVISPWLTKFILLCNSKKIPFMCLNVI